MKRKNILASVSACAIALSAMALSASAAIKNATPDSNDGTGYTYDCKTLDYNNIYGIKAEITFDGAVVDQTKGGLAFNADDTNGTGWNQFDWELDASGNAKDNTNKNIKIDNKGDGKYVLTLVQDKAYLADCAEWKWANIYIGSWGGTDFTVNSLVPLDKDGKEVGAAAATTTAAVETVGAETTSAETKEDAEGTTSASETTAAKTTTAAAKTTAAATTAAKADATKAGDNGVGLAVAGLALGAAAMFIARKKH